MISQGLRLFTAFQRVVGPGVGSKNQRIRRFEPSECGLVRRLSQVK